MKKKRSYSFIFMRGFMMTLFVPMITILLLFIQAKSTVREQILLSGEGTLNQFFSRVDALTEEMKGICISIAADAECQGYAMYSKYRPEKVAYQTLKTREVLSKFSSEKFYDIFVYFPNENSIVSSANSSLSVEYYFETYYRRLGGDGFYEEFKEVLNQNYKRPTLFSMNTDSNMSFLGVAMKQYNYKDDGLSYVVVLILEPSYVNKMVLGGQMEEGRLLIFNRDKELLMSSGSSEVVIGLDGYDGSSAMYEQEFSDDIYIMQVQESNVLENYYAFATPSSYFWRQLWRLYLICGIGGFICLTMSLYVAYRGAKRAYHPLETFVARLQKQGGVLYNKGKDTEFEFLEAVFKEKSEESLKFKQKARIGENIKQERFLYALLQGETQFSNSDNIYQENNIILCSDLFFVAVMKVEQLKDMDSNLQAFIVSNVFNEIEMKEHKSYVLFLRDNYYVILLNLKYSVEEEQLIEMMKEGKIFLEQHYGMKIALGTSPICGGKEGIAEAYQKAEKALAYRYLLGTQGILCYERISERRFKYNTSDESKLSKMLMVYIHEKGVSKSIAHLLSDIMDAYEIDENASLESVECFKFEVLGIINKMLLSNGYSSDFRKEMVNRLLSESSFEQFKEAFVDIVADLIEKEREKELNDVWVKAHSYIEEHYNDAELSVTMLGQEMNITPSYLSKLFLENYGISIPDYIAKIRIKNAKEDLRNTTYSIKEISVRNGFLSSNVFIKTFKKLEGITPGICRKLS